MKTSTQSFWPILYWPVLFLFTGFLLFYSQGCGLEDGEVSLEAQKIGLAHFAQTAEVGQAGALASEPREPFTGYFRHRNQYLHYWFMRNWTPWYRPDFDRTPVPFFGLPLRFLSGRLMPSLKIELVDGSYAATGGYSGPGYGFRPFFWSP